MICPNAKYWLGNTSLYRLTWFQAVIRTMLKLTAFFIPPERHNLRQPWGAACRKWMATGLTPHYQESTLCRDQTLVRAPPSHGSQEQQSQNMCSACNDGRWKREGGMRRWSGCLWSSRHWLYKKGGRMRERPRFLMIVQVHDGKVRAEVNRSSVGYTAANHLWHVTWY